MKRNLTWLFILSVAGILYLSSCSQTTTKYTLVGTFIDSCGGSPVIEANVSIYGYKGNFTNRNRVDFGNANTDANGFFAIADVNLLELSFDFSYNGDRYQLYRDYNLGRIKRTGDTINLGIIYLDYESYSAIELKTKGNHAPTDTLYIGSKANDFISISPIKDSTVIFHYRTSYGPAEPSNMPQKNLMYWGIGKQQFEQNSKGNLPENLEQYQIEVNVGLCNAPLSSTLYIP